MEYIYGWDDLVFDMLCLKYLFIVLPQPLLHTVAEKSL